MFCSCSKLWPSVANLPRKVLCVVICAVYPLNKLRWFLESAWSQDIPCIVLTVSSKLDLWLTVKLLQREDSKADLRYSL